MSPSCRDDISDMSATDKKRLSFEGCSRQTHLPTLPAKIAIAIGSLIPMGMYMMWCYTALGGGLDSTTASGARVAAFTVPTPSFQ
jgi:hypothetical protein